MVTITSQPQEVPHPHHTDWSQEYVVSTRTKCHKDQPALKTWNMYVLYIAWSGCWVCCLAVLVGGLSEP